jgi:hypothetical protein
MPVLNWSAEYKHSVMPASGTLLCFFFLTTTFSIVFVNTSSTTSQRPLNCTQTSTYSCLRPAKTLFRLVSGAQKSRLTNPAGSKDSRFWANLPQREQSPARPSAKIPPKTPSLAQHSSSPFFLPFSFLSLLSLPA